MLNSLAPSRTFREEITWLGTALRPVLPVRAVGYVGLGRKPCSIERLTKAFHRQDTARTLSRRASAEMTIAHRLYGLFWSERIVAMYTSKVHDGHARMLHPLIRDADTDRSSAGPVRVGGLGGNHPADGPRPSTHGLVAPPVRFLMLQRRLRGAP